MAARTLSRHERSAFITDYLRSSDAITKKKMKFCDSEPRTRKYTWAKAGRAVPPDLEGLEVEEVVEGLC